MWGKVIGKMAISPDLSSRMHPNIEDWQKNERKEWNFLNIFHRKTSNLKVGLGRKEEGRKERIERKKTGKKNKKKHKETERIKTFPYCCTRT